MKFVLSTSFSKVAHLTAIAPVADDCGWEAMSFSDHVVHPRAIATPYPYTDDGSRRWDAFTDWPDPWVTIGALAAITRRLRFTNNVFVLPMRNPYLVAKAISTAAVISDNRVTPALGVGWSGDEFALMQQDFRTRGKRTDEMIEVMRLLWSGDWVEYQGEYYQFEAMEMNPAPSARIPIWVGGISEPAMRRAARLADGWVTDLQTSDEIVESIRRIHAWRRDHRASIVEHRQLHHRTGVDRHNNPICLSDHGSVCTDFVPAGRDGEKQPQPVTESRFNESAEM